MKRFFTILTSAIFLILASPCLAATATTSADNAVVNSNIEDRIKNIVQQNLSTTEALIKERINENSLSGYVGKITNISSMNLTLMSGADTIQVKTSEKTVYSKSNQAVKSSSLAIGDKVIVVGLLARNDIIDAKRIVIVKDSISTLPLILSSKI